MANTIDLRNKTVFITGGSRGIGLAIALRLAKAGANIVIAAKTTDPNPKLPGTIYSAAESIKALGAQCLPLQTDIRDELQIKQAVEQAVQTFGGIDILINNASAIQLTPTEVTPMKRFDLMFGVNVRGTFATTQACLPYLKASAKSNRNPHVLTLSPPLNMQPKWFGPHAAYTMAKYGMSMCVLGHAEEFKSDGIAVNALWPRTVIQTAALQMIPGIRREHCRTTNILADAAYEILHLDVAQAEHSGNFFIDEEVLKRYAHLNDFDKYSVVPDSKSLLTDLFLD
jgi:citronellol/citronellal dehydrogenase